MSRGPRRRLTPRACSRTLQLPNPDTFGDRYPHEVSGGQLQRAMAAMAMSCRPDIIVLDEPTTALDVTTQIEVLALLRDLIREFGTAGLYITHDLAVVAQIAHRIMVLRHGKMVEVGDAKQILEQPRTPYATALVNERRDADAHLPLIDPPGGAEPVLSVNARRGWLLARARRSLGRINVTIARGETLAVVGESGSGKSRWRASSSACCRDRPATSSSRARRSIAGDGQPSARRAAPPADGASDAGRGAQSAPDAGRYHRPPGLVLFQSLCGRDPDARRRIAEAGRPARGFRARDGRDSSPAARSSASASRERSPPSRT